MKLTEFLKEVSLPRGLSEIELTDTRLVPYKKFMDMADNFEPNLTALIPIIDNPVWVAGSPGKGYYSCDSDGEILFTSKGNKILSFMEKGPRGLRARETFTPNPEAMIKGKTESLDRSTKPKNFTFKEEITMDLKGGNNLNLGNLQNSLKEMNLGGNAPTATAPVPEQIKDTVSVSSMETDTMKSVHAFNYSLGKLHFLVTRADHKVSFSVVSSAKKKSANGSGSDFAQHGSAVAPTDNAPKLYDLVIKDAKPSPVIGGLISMPAGGIFTNKELTSGLDDNKTPIKVNQDDTVLKYALYSKDELLFRIINSFGRKIKEDAETYGENHGVVSAVIKRQQKVEKTADGVAGRKKDVLVPKFIAPKGRSLVVDGAFFPLKTFDYIEQGSNPTQESVDVLNYSAFAHMFKVSKKTNRAPHDNLAAEYKNDVKQDTSKEMSIGGVNVPLITSKYFTLDGTRKTIICKKWTSKDAAPYENIKIPRKKAVVSKDKDKPVMPRVITCDCVKDKTKEDYSRLSSLESGEFAGLINKFPEYLNYDKLKQTFALSDKQRSSLVDRDRETLSVLSEWNNDMLTSLTDTTREIKFAVL